jgi:hypothetical protein
MMMTRREHLLHREGWPITRPAYDPEALVLTNIGFFAQCRNDRLCRCRKCKPPIKKG